MEIIPLIRLFHKNNKKEIEKQNKQIIEEIKSIEAFEKIYFLDYAGLQKNKPNLCTYQKISKDYEIIVDTGPRNTEDIVDNLMSGATHITIRKELWQEKDILKIKNLTENPIYQIFKNRIIEKSDIFEETNGIIIIKEDGEIEYSEINYLQKFIKDYDLFYYEKNPENKKYLEKTGIKNLIVDIEKIKGFY